MPLVVLIARMLIDVGFVVARSAEDVEASPIVGAALPSEVGPAVGYLILGYAAIAAGLVAVWAIWWLYSKPRPKSRQPSALPPDVWLRGWRASRVAFWFGLLMHLISLVILVSSGSSVVDLARRAAFTNAEALSNLSYGIARTFSLATLVGAVGMIVFSRNAVMRRWGILGGIAHAGIQAMFGGRDRVVFAVVAVVVAVVWADERVKMRTVVRVLVVPAALLLTYIYVVRFEIPTPTDIVNEVVEDGTSALRVNGMAFMTRNVPEVIPHTKWAPLLAAGSHALPAVDIPGGESPWPTIVRVLYDGTNPFPGVGGFNFPTAAESYLAFGTAGVVWLGLAYGAFFGVVFEWHRRRWHNPFVTLLTIMVLIAFYAGIHARMAAALGGLAVSVLLPVVIITAASLPRRMAWQASIAAYTAAVGFLAFLLVRDSAFPQAGRLAQLAKLGTMAALGGLYLWGLLLLNRSDRLAAPSLEVEPAAGDARQLVPSGAAAPP